jgi:hypothetical protein
MIEPILRLDAHHEWGISVLLEDDGRGDRRLEAVGAARAHHATKRA